MRVAIVFGVLVLSGCVAMSEPVTMVNPANGQTAKCGPYSLHGMVANASALREVQCVEDYKQQGFVRR